MVNVQIVMAGSSVLWTAWFLMLTGSTEVWGMIGVA